MRTPFWLLAFLGLAAARSQAADFTVTPIGLSGEPAPGAAAAPFVSFRNPTLGTTGDVAFVGTVDASTSPFLKNGAWLGDGIAPLSMLIYEGTPAPGMGGTLVSLWESVPVSLGGEYAAVLGFVSIPPPQEDQLDVLFGPDGVGGLGPVIQEGAAAPGIPSATVSLVGETFLASPTGGLVVWGHASTIAGFLIWGSSAAGGPLAPWVVPGPAPLVPGITPGEQIFDPYVAQQNALDVTDTVAYFTGLGFATAVSSGLWTRDAAGMPTLLARTGQDAPETSGALFGTIGYLGQVRTSAGQVLFRGTLEAGTGVVPGGNDVGLWLADETGTVSLVMRGLDPAPGAPAGAAFSTANLGEGADVDAVGGIAFHARMLPGLGGVTTANDGGVWGPDGQGGFTLRVREGDPVPGREGETYGLFEGDVVVNGLGEVVFRTRFAPSGDDAIGFLAADGAASILLAEGDAFPVAPGDLRTISEAGTLYMKDAFNDASQIAVRLVFEGGSQGVFRLDVPEPEAGGVAAAMIVALLAWRRRGSAARRDGRIRTRSARTTRRKARSTRAAGQRPRRRPRFRWRDTAW